MGAGDKMKHQAEEAKGKTKKAVGDATDNERMEAEGRREETEAEFKQAGDKLKDAGRDAKDAFDR
jgi:uncharacterized protein YjbJ (UPF0337 family)